MSADLIARSHRPGGGFRWSIDTTDPHLLVAGILLSRGRQPSGAPTWDEGRTTLRHGERDDVTGEETKGWSIDYFGWTHRSGWTLSFEAGSRLGRLVRWAQWRARSRANRRRARVHGGHGGDASAPLVAIRLEDGARFPAEPLGFLPGEEHDAAP